MNNPAPFLNIRKTRFYRCAFVCVHDAEVTVRTSRGLKRVIPPHTLCFITKNTVADIRLKSDTPVKIYTRQPYDILWIDNALLGELCRVMTSERLVVPPAGWQPEPVFCYTQASGTDLDVLRGMERESLPRHQKIYHLAFLLSKMPNQNALILSLLSSAGSMLMTDRISVIVESDLSRQWTLTDISKRLHVSPETVKKTLKKEDNTFTALLMDIRMHRAARKLALTDTAISVIAGELGYGDASYFVSCFRKYYGITPAAFSRRMRFKQEQAEERREYPDKGVV